MLSQIIAVTGVNLRSIRQRLGSSAVAIVGIAGVVVVFLGVLSIARGLQGGDVRRRRSADRHRHARGQRHRDDERHRAANDATIVMDTPGIERDERGPIASPELFVIVGHPTKKDPSDANVPLRGVSAAALKVRPAAEDRRRPHVHARAPTRSSSARRRRSSSPNLTVGSSTQWGQNTLAGRRASSTPTAARRSRRSGATRRCCSPPISAATATSRSTSGSQSADGFQAFKDALTANPRLSVTAIREPEYYAAQSRGAAPDHPARSGSSSRG